MSEAEISEYLRLAKELVDVNYELMMVSKLIDKTQTELDYARLKSLQPYMTVIVRKMGELQGRKVELERRLERLKPPFIRFIDTVQEHIERLREMLRSVYHGKMSLSDLWRSLSAVKERIPKMLEGLNKSRDIILRLKSSAPKEVARFLDEKLATIRALADYLSGLSQFVSIDPSRILRYKKNLGKTIIVEPSNKACIVSEVYISPKGELFLEVSEEQEIDSEALNALYREIGFDFMASDIVDFREKLLRRMQSRLQICGMKPSLIKSFLREEGLLSSLSRETLEKLRPKYSVVGYAPVNAVGSTPTGLRMSEDRLLKECEDLIKCPSVKSLPEGIIGKIIRLENKYYLVVTQTFIPLLGRVLICLQQDINGEPLPHISLMEKIFRFLAKKETAEPSVKKYVSRALRLIQSGKNIDDAYWTLRILITRAGLQTSRRITESNALRPSYIFSYCLQNSIPLLFPEIVSHYIYVIETDLVEMEGKEPKIKIPVMPRPFFEVFDISMLNMMIGNICSEVLGILSENNNIILVCAPPLSSEIVRRKSEEYDIPLDFAQTASRLIRALIYFGKIRSITEYRALLDELNVQHIIYNELVGSIEENDELVAAHALLLRLMRAEGA